MVIADRFEAARNAAERIAVEYRILPAVTGVVAATTPGAPQLYEDVPGNLCCDWALGDAAATDAAFAKADHVAKIDLVNNRLVPNAMESRAALAEYEPATGDYTLYTSTQLPHVARVLIGVLILGIPERKLRVVAPDVGGGFGSKQVVYAEEGLVTWAARKLERPVKWVADRSEAFLSDAQGRDHVTHAELALDRDGKFLGLRVSTQANIGAYVSTFGPNIPTNLYGPLLAGVYTTPAIYCEVKVVFTNTVPTDAYRAAGRPEATFVLERLVDIAARDLGIDRVEIRRRNFIPLGAFPYQTPVTLQYDSGDHNATLAKALDVSRWSSFPARREEAAGRGKLRGIGIVTYIEPVVWHPHASRASSARAAACSRAPMSASIPRATSPSSPARIIMAKAMKRSSPSSLATCSAYRAASSRSSMAIPRAAPSVSAPIVRARPRSAAAPSRRRSAKSSTRAERLRATCSRPASRISNSPPASSRSAAPTAV